MILILSFLLFLSGFSKSVKADPVNIKNWRYCGKTIHLKTHNNGFNGFYISATSDFRLEAKRGKSNSTKFLIECLSDNKVALKTYLNRYVVAVNDQDLLADRQEARSWERFEVYTSNRKENGFGFLSHKDKYMVAESDLTVKADRDWLRSYETFVIELNGDEPPPVTQCIENDGGILRYPQHKALVGHTTATTAEIYAYAGAGRDVELQYKIENDNIDDCKSVSMQPRRERQNTSLAKLTGLNANTRYQYDVLVDGRIAASGAFTTAPANKNNRFKYAVFSCSRYQHDTVQLGYRKALDLRPSFSLMLGDNVYAHTVDRNARLNIHHKKQRDIQNFANFIANTPTYAVWDDHDFGNNNSQGGPVSEHPARERSRQAFMDVWANSSYGENGDGVYHSFRWGAVEYFMLDGRYFKNKDSNPRVFIGQKQLNWLKNGLRKSDAVFKVVANGQTLMSGSEGWIHAREELFSLFDFIRANRIKGVLFHAGDVHQNRYANHGARRGSDFRVGYDVQEIISSGVGNRNNGSWTMIDVDTTDSNPRNNFIKVTYYKQMNKADAVDATYPLDDNVRINDVIIRGSDLGY